MTEADSILRLVGSLSSTEPIQPTYSVMTYTNTVREAGNTELDYQRNPQLEHDGNDIDNYDYIIQIIKEIFL